MKTIHSLAVAAFAATQFASAADWAQWRGPQFNGSSPETALPAAWSKTDGLAWAVSLPGPSAATPVIWKDHIFISSEDTSKKELLALALDRATGKIHWTKQTGIGTRRDDKSNLASPSPATDGKRAIFFYGNGFLVAFDFAGEKLWERNIETDYGQFAFQWTFASTPLLYEGKLYLQVLQRDVPVHGRGAKDGPIQSFLLVIDPATGKTLSKVVRPSEAKAESRESFASPVPFEHKGQKQILVAGGDDLTAHDPNTGQELWRWGTWNPTRIGHWRLVPSPVAGQGIILACAPKSDPIYGIRAGGKGQLDASAIAWTGNNPRELSSDVPTPAFYAGDFFVLSDVRKSLLRVEPATGAVKWKTPLPGSSKFEASPTLADGKAYLMNFKGEVVVIDAEKGSLLNTIAMGDEGDNETRSSVVVAHGHLFVRTNQKLYCVGPK